MIEKCMKKHSQLQVFCALSQEERVIREFKQLRIGMLLKRVKRGRGD
jgi:hypothetical protein